MRITLINATLEPARDGVGDYCFRLAEELTRLGHEPSLCALNDSFAERLHDEIWRSNTPLLRIPKKTSDLEKRAILSRWSPLQSADAASLQFVGYAFQDRGIVFSLPTLLEPAFRPTRHLMFHEIWIGGATRSNLKDRMTGILQRWSIERLVQRWRPGAMHTTNEAYKRLLARHGIHTDVLPLFSNIPILNSNGAWMKEQLTSFGIPEEERSNWRIFGIFGSVPEEWSEAEFLRHVLPLSRACGRKVAVLAMGHHGARRLDTLAGSTDIWFHNFGPQPDSRVSEFLQGIDFGVAVAPADLLGKSGACAAFREHGVPIVVLRPAMDYGAAIDAAIPDGVVTLWNASAEDLEQETKKPMQSRLPEAARLLIQSLAATEGRHNNRSQSN